MLITLKYTIIRSVAIEANIIFEADIFKEIFKNKIQIIWKLIFVYLLLVYVIKYKR